MSPREKETARLTRRVLKALARAAGRVEVRGETVRIAPLPGQNGREIEMPARLYRTLLADGLLSEPGEGRVRTSTEGRAWLRRALSGGDGFAEQHRETTLRPIGDKDSACATVRVDLSESPLAWLASRKRADGRKWITPVQLEAGERLRADYTRGHLMARVTADWGDSVHHGRKRTGEGRADLADAVLDARERVHRALAAVGPELSGVLVDVCCELQGLEALERRHGWPARSGKLVLALALSVLARHYGLSGEARGPGRARARHWGTADYRPRLGKKK